MPAMAGTEAFQYETAFSSNLGLLSPEEQSRLRQATVALAGMGGVGGAHLLTLTRLGVGRFTIADGDVFELSNLNRQTGATLATLGRPKVEVMAEMARAINPELAIRTFPHGIDDGNIRDFLSGADIVVDGIDFFEMATRRLLFRQARAQGLSVVTCGPLGFGVASLAFGPNGMSFDEFMALDEGMDETEQLLRFAVGLAPAGLHLPYLDRTRISVTKRRGPSSAIAIDLCAAVAATEVLCFLLKRRALPYAPRYAHFDPYRQRYCTGTLWLGNRHPLQRVKRWVLKRRLRQQLATS